MTPSKMHVDNEDNLTCGRKNGGRILIKNDSEPNPQHAAR